MKRDPNPSPGTPPSLEVGKKKEPPAKETEELSHLDRKKTSHGAQVTKEFQEGAGDYLCQLLLKDPGKVWELPTGICMWRPQLIMGGMERTEI